MNACIRAVTRTALSRGLRVVGILHGYSGLLSGSMSELKAFSVSNILQHGGTILKTARCEEFETIEGRNRAADMMEKFRLDALVVIGGNGTFQGASYFQDEHKYPVIGCPGTIDNDLYGTDWTIGYDTAVNTAIYNIDKIRDTADALERTFYIEVMGRSSGFIALDVGLSCGAEYISIPETETKIEVLLELFQKQRATKRSNIIIVAEGYEEGGALRLAQRIKEANGMEYRVTILGHIQRGGSPTARDRILASKLGSAAVDALLSGDTCVMMGETNGKLVRTPMHETWEKTKPIDQELLALSRLLAM
jgi:6-phosphofructokinase 1